MRTVIRRTLIVVCALAVSLALVPVAAAYEEISVVKGGSLAGTVLLDGKVPPPKGYNLTTLPDAVYCGRGFRRKGLASAPTVQCRTER